MNNLPLSFLSRMKTILGEKFDAFVDSFNSDSQKAIYVNQNKIDVDFFKSIVDFPVSPIPYEMAGFYVNNDKLGRHALHHAGAFYIQEPSAMFTVNSLDFKGDEYVLDMCASPGGKTIQIANRIPNGLLVSNEIVKSRSEILFSNVERMGLKNVVITNNSPIEIASAYANCFDVCLVDAPCSGEGMFRKGDDMVKSWNENLPKMCAERQLEILKQANDCVKCGGYIIYSTCTYSLEENELVVKEFLKKHNYKLINISAPSNFSRGVDLPETVRLYPHEVSGEGQFVAVLKKLEENDKTSKPTLKLKEDLIAKRFLKEYVEECENVFTFNNFSYYALNPEMIKRNVNYVSLGVKLGSFEKNRFIPHHNLFTAFGDRFKLKIDLSYNDILTLKYLKGETFDAELPDGFGAILVDGCSVGGFKISGGSFKNLYPKGLRNFKI